MVTIALAVVGDASGSPEAFQNPGRYDLPGNLPPDIYHALAFTGRVDLEVQIGETNG